MFYCVRKQNLVLTFTRISFPQSAVEDESFVVTESKKEAAAAAGTSPGESVSGRAADADPALGAQASEQHDMEVGSALGDGDTPLDNSGDSDSEEEEVSLADAEVLPFSVLTI